MSSSKKLEAIDVHKSYSLERTEVPVLRGVSFEVEHGEWVALLGASGSGKTTLLNLLGTLEKPDKGDIRYNGDAFGDMGNSKKVLFRRQRVGFIFQFYHMLPELTILENVKLPGKLDNVNERELDEKAKTLLKRVKLDHRLRHRPNELSGGEQQRAAIARALINSPQLILADEPTGNLDSKTGAGIMEIFQEIHGENPDHIFLMVTHDRNIASQTDRIIELVDGQIK